MRKRVFLFLGAASCCLWVLSGSASGQVISQDKVGKIDSLMQAYHDNGRFNGAVLVAEGGKVIYKKGFGLANMEWDIPNTPGTKFRIGSVTKQFTSMLVLQMVGEGKIRLDGKLSDYLSYYRPDTGKKVTIHHLLTHTSGIPSYTNLPNFTREAMRTPYGVEEFVKKFCSGDLEFEPGARFSYDNSGYFLLGAIVEKIAGKPYEEVLEQRIFQPLGMRNSGYDHHQTILSHRAAGYSESLAGFKNAAYIDTSSPFAAGAVYSTVEDLYLWDQALYTDKLLSPQLKGLLFMPHAQGPGPAYGYGWYVGKKTLPRSKREIAFTTHGGGISGFGALIERLTEDRHLVVLLSNTGPTTTGEMSTVIARILYDEPYELPKKSIARTLYKTIQDQGLEAGLSQYRKLKKAQPMEYDFRFAELNSLGYALLEGERTDDAIRIFQLNVESFPRDGNAYDSLAEAYAAKGDKTQAIKNYAKSLELDPENTNAVEQLKRLIKNE